MVFCHGSGDLVRDGCCYVNGQVCPLRWKIVAGSVIDANGLNLGTVEQVATSLGANKPQRDRVVRQLQGVTFLCKAVIDAVVADPKVLTDRAALEQAWHNHPDYVALVRPAWATIEQNLGLPTGSYNCGTWQGTGKPQCCFAEDPTTNAEKAAPLHSEARQVRQAGGT